MNDSQNSETDAHDLATTVLGSSYFDLMSKSHEATATVVITTYADGSYCISHCGFSPPELIYILEHAKQEVLFGGGSADSDGEEDEDE